VIPICGIFSNIGLARHQRGSTHQQEPRGPACF